MSNLKLSFEHDGQVGRVALAAPKANIVDQAMMTALAAAFEDLRNRPQLKVMILTAEGPHFSFGASVQEHLPEHVRTMLPRFSRLLGQLLGLPAVTVAAVGGQCLGGGFELALACDLSLRRKAPSSLVPKSSWQFSARGRGAVAGPDWRKSRGGTRVDRNRMERRPSCGSGIDRANRAPRTARSNG